MSRYRSVEEVLGGEPAGASRGDEHATVVCAAEETRHEHQIGSFGVRLTRDETVADSVWTKVVFNEVSWDTLGGFDHDTGDYTVGCAGKFHFAAGVRFLTSQVPNQYVDLLL